MCATDWPLRDLWSFSMRIIAQENICETQSKYIKSKSYGNVVTGQKCFQQAIMLSDGGNVGCKRSKNKGFDKGNKKSMR